MIFGIVWWLLSLEVLFGLAILFSVGYEKQFSTFLLTLFAGVSIWAFSGMPNVIDAVSTNSSGIVFWTVAYLLTGVVWGVFKYWVLYTRSEEMREQIRVGFTAFKEHENKNGTVEDFAKSRYYPFGFKQDYPKISTWIIWWPFSFAWTLTNDLLSNIALFIGRQFSGFFAWIARGAVNSALKDVKG